MNNPETTTPVDVNSKIVKVVVVGSGGVGKTCIIARLVSGNFIESQMTVGLNIESWMIHDEKNKASRRFISMDLGGQEQFRFMHELFLKGASIILAVFDISRYESLIDIEKWHKFTNEMPNSCFVLVGNKIDLPYLIQEEEIIEIEDRWNTTCIQVSAVTGANFDQLEQTILDSLKKIQQMDTQ